MLRYFNYQSSMLIFRPIHLHTFCNLRKTIIFSIKSSRRSHLFNFSTIQVFFPPNSSSSWHILSVFASPLHYQKRFNTVNFKSSFNVLPVSKALIAAYADRNKFDTILTKLHQRNLLDILNHLAKSDRSLPVLFAVLKWMEQNDTPPKVMEYTKIISLLGRTNQWEQALKIFKKMNDLKVTPDAITYNVLMKVLGKGKQWKQTLQLFECMQKENISPNIGTYNVLIDTLGKHNQWEYALRIFKSMKTANIVPNTKTYNALISAMEQGHQWKYALDVFENMLEKKNAPDADTYRTLIIAVGKENQWEQAYYIFRNMKKNGFILDNITYKILIDVMSNETKWDKAFEIYKYFEKTCSDSIYIKYTTFINALEKGRQWTHASHILKEMEKECYTYMITMVRENQWAEALHAYDEFQKAGGRLDCEMYNLIINALKKVNQWEWALRLFKDMKIEEVTPNIKTYNAIIDVLGKANQWEQAEKIFLSMKKKVVPTCETYNLVMFAFANGEQNKKILPLFKKMLGKGIIPNLTTCNHVLDVLWEHDQKKANIVFYHAIQDGTYGVFLTKSHVEWKLDLRCFSIGSARAAVMWWLIEHVMISAQEDKLPTSLTIIIGQEKSRKTGHSDVKKKVRKLLQSLEVPVRKESDKGSISLRVDMMPMFFRKLDPYLDPIKKKSSI